MTPEQTKLAARYLAHRYAETAATRDDLTRQRQQERDRRAKLVARQRRDATGRWAGVLTQCGDAA